MANNFANFNAAFPAGGGGAGAGGGQPPRQYNAAPMTMVPPRSSGLVAGAPLPGQTAHQLSLKAHEKSLFDSLFYSCEGSRGMPSAVSGSAVKGLFTASRLPKASLALVWQLSDRQRRKVLDIEDFYIACRLIAIAQQNLPITYQSLQTYMEIPLPQFEGINSAAGAVQMQQQQPLAAMPPLQQQQQPGLQQQPRKMNAAPMTSVGGSMGGAPMMGGGMLGGQNRGMDLLGVGAGGGGTGAGGAQFPVSMGRSSFSGPSGGVGPGPNLLASPMAGGGGGAGGLLSAPSTPASSAMAAPVADEWTMTDMERTQYMSLFSQADADGDNFVGGKEANIFFKQSGLDNATLKQIWLLSDVDRDNKLNPDEFAIAMHLTLRVRKKQALPATLPLSMDPRHKPLTVSVATPSAASAGLGMMGGLGGSMMPPPDLGGAGGGGAGAGGKQKLNLDFLPEILPSPAAAAPAPQLLAVPQQPPQQQPQQDFLSFDGNSGASNSNLPSSKPASRRVSTDFGFGPSHSTPQLQPLQQTQTPLQKSSSFGFSGMSLNTATPSNGVQQQGQGQQQQQQPGQGPEPRGYALIEATQALDTRTEHLQSLTNQTEQTRRASGAADARLEEKLKLLEGVEVQIQAQERLLEEQRQALQGFDAQHVEAEQRLEAAKQRLKDAQESLKAGDAHAKEVQESTATLKREAAETEMAVTLLESQLTSLRSSLKGIEDLKDNQSNIVQARREQQSRLLHEKRELQEMLDQSKMQLAAMKEEATIIKEGLKAHQEGVDEMHTLLEEHKDIVQQEKLRPSPKSDFASNRQVFLGAAAGPAAAGVGAASVASAVRQSPEPVAATTTTKVAPLEPVGAGAASANNSNSVAPVVARKPTHDFSSMGLGDDDAFNIDDIHLPTLGSPMVAASASASSPAPAAATMAPAAPAASAEHHAPQSKVAAAVGQWNRGASVDWSKQEITPTPLPPASPAVAPASSPAGAPTSASHHASTPSNSFPSSAVPSALTLGSPLANSASPQSGASSSAALVSPPAPAVPSFPHALQGTGVPAFNGTPVAAADAAAAGEDEPAADSGNPWDSEPAGDDPFGAAPAPLGLDVNLSHDPSIAPAVLSPAASSVFGEDSFFGNDDPFAASPPLVVTVASPPPTTAATTTTAAAAAAPTTSPSHPAPSASDFGDFGDDGFDAPAPAAAAPAASAVVTAPAAAAPTDKKASVAASFDAAMSDDWAAFD